MARVQCFEAIAGNNPVVLILGSMPGTASLNAGQYYAHPRNSFWKILAELLQFDSCLSYGQRVEALLSTQIALWDVIHSCVRPGSLDANIARDGLIVNDFDSFFKTNPQVQQVFFNGAQAELSYNRYVRPKLNIETICYTRLPSTSPANATMPYTQKLEAWRLILMHLKRDMI